MLNKTSRYGEFLRLENWRRWAVSNSTQFAYALLGTILLLVYGYLWRLGTSPAGFGPAEKANLSNADSIHSLTRYPLNLPHNALNLLVNHFRNNAHFSNRFVSVVFALIFIWCFYYLARILFGRFSAWLAAILLAFTPLVLLAGRSAAADIMVLMPLVLAACYMWLIRSKTPSLLHFFCLASIAALCLYEPGGFYLVAAGVLMARKTLAGLFRHFPVEANIVAALIFLVLLTPLGWAIFNTPAFIKTLLLIPQAVPSALDFVKKLAWTTLAVFWRSGTPSVLQIGRLPLLNSAQLVLLFFGLYAMWTKARSKIYMLVGVVAFAVAASALNSNFNLLLVALPPLTIFMCAGFRYLHLEWTTVFPRNPLPRALAKVLMITVVIFSAYYGVHYALNAWPHTAATKALFMLK